MAKVVKETQDIQHCHHCDYRSMEEIADILSISVPRVKQLQKTGHIPRPIKRRYGFELRACVHGYITFLRASKRIQNESKNNEDPLDPNEELAKLRREQTIGKEFENRKAAGELIEVIDYEREMASVIKKIANWLEILPDKLEREAGLTPKQIRKMRDITDAQRVELYEKITGNE